MGGVGNNLVDGEGLIEDAIDKRGVGTILQQTTNQIGEQVSVVSYRGVDSTGRGWKVNGVEFIVEHFTHTMKALIFKRLPFSQLSDSGQSVGVMGGKLGVETLRSDEQSTGTGDIGDICGHFSGEDRVVVKTQLLCQFDFAIPVGPFHQPHHELVSGLAGESGKPVDDGRSSFLVRLDSDSKPIPAREAGTTGDLLKEFKGQFKAITLFRIDGDANSRLLCCSGKVNEVRGKLFEEPFPFWILKAGVKG